MVSKRAQSIGNCTRIRMAAAGHWGSVEKFIDSLNPKTAAKSSKTYNKDLISTVKTFMKEETRSLRKMNRGSDVQTRATMMLDFPCRLISNGAFDPSSVFAAHLVESSVEHELEIEYYSEVPIVNIAEHVVISNGTIDVCESRPWREPQPNGDYRNWGGFRMIFEGRPQRESEDAAQNAAAARPKPRAAQTRQVEEPPAPWQTHREDFMATPRNAETDALEEKFECQAKLLGELVAPVEYDATFVRSATMPNGKDLADSGAYAQHMRKVYLNYIDQNKRGYRTEAKICKPLYDVVCFQVANDKAAFLNNVCDLGDIPFQGSGGFGLAVVPSSLKRADVDEVFTKIALCQFLEAAPQDLECIVVTRASKLDLKRLGEIEDAGIPIVFDLSGRTSPTKEKRDPLENMFSKPTRGPHVFNGRLSESQVALLGDSLSDEAASSMLQALREAALEETTSYLQAQWTDEIVDTMTFGREVVKHNSGKAGTPTAPSHYYAHSIRLRYVEPSVPWQFVFATFPPESMPTLDSARAIKRMRDVGTIWRTTLKEYGLALYTERARGLRRNRNEEPYMPDKDALQEVGRFLGIDTMIESLYDGVPLDYIL